MAEGPEEPDARWLTALQFVAGAAAVAIIGRVSTPIVVLVGVLAGLVVLAALYRSRSSGRQSARIKPRFARKRWFGWVITLTTVVLIAVAAYQLGIRKSDSVANVTATAVLTELVDESLRDSCEAQDAAGRDVLARIRCRDVKRGVAATFARYATSAALEEAFRRRVYAASALPGDCLKVDAAVGPYDLAGETVGQLLCTATSRGSSLVWTNRELRVLATASKSRRGGPSLLQWWSDTGSGLLEPSDSGLRLRFPDEYERRLLTHVPDAFRRTCRRDPYSLRGSRATVRCTPGRRADAAYYLLFTDRRKLADQVRRRARENRSLEGSCSRTREEPAVAKYRDGTRICYDEGKSVSWVEWSDDELLIYAYANRRPQNLWSLYRWWEDEAGPQP